MGGRVGMGDITRRMMRMELLMIWLKLDLRSSAKQTRTEKVLGDVEGEIVERRCQGLKVVDIRRWNVGHDGTIGILAGCKTLTRVSVRA